MTQKVTSYFNIFECGRKLLDQLNVTYQRAFMATPEDEYYKEMTKCLIKANNEGGKLCNENIQQAVIDLGAELNGEHTNVTSKTSHVMIYISLLRKRKMYQQLKSEEK